MSHKSYVQSVEVQAVANDTSVQPELAAKELQPLTCVQGNLDPMLMVLGGQPLIDGARRICDAFAGGPHIFNLGHGITPDADPSHVDSLLQTIRA